MQGAFPVSLMRAELAGGGAQHNTGTAHPVDTGEQLWVASPELCLAEDFYVRSRLCDGLDPLVVAGVCSLDKTC